MNMAVDPAMTGAGARVRTQLLEREELLALGPEWETLTDNALEENAYYCRQYAEALLTHIDRRPVRALAVWQGPHLIALLPFVTDRRHWGGAAALNRAWTTPYTMLSVPLIDRRDAEAAAEALVAAMGDLGSTAWLLPDMTLEGPVNRLLRTAFAERNIATATLDPFERAVLAQGDTFDSHMKTHVSKKRRKDLVRNRKRLGEQGDVTQAVFEGGNGLDRAVDEFLRIEASGWKGRRGTALACSDATRDFARQAFGTHDGKSMTRADLLLLDGKAIAANLSLQTGRTAFTIKCAFDEAYKTQSAGLLLEENMIRSFLTEGWADRLDSATAPGHLIQGLWNGSVTVGDVLLDAARKPSKVRFGIYLALEKSRRGARARAKALLNRLRR